MPFIPIRLLNFTEKHCISSALLPQSRLTSFTPLRFDLTLYRPVLPCLRRMTTAKGVRITFNVDIEVPPLVLGDRARLDQVLSDPICLSVSVADSE